MTPSIKSKHFICKRYQSPAFNICKFLTTRTMPLTHHFRGKISVIFCNNSHYQNFTIYIYAYLRSVDCKTLCSSTSYSICTIFERFYNGCIKRSHVENSTTHPSKFNLSLHFFLGWLVVTLKNSLIHLVQNIC